MKINFKKALFCAATLLLANNINVNAQSTVLGNNYTPGSFLGWGTSSGDVEFKVNNSTKMLLQNTTGNVGIGTTTPKAPLNVIGSNAIASSTVPANGAFFVGSAGTNLALTMGVSTTNPIHSWIQSRNQGTAGTYYNLALQPLGGAVGIGTYNPIQTLDVNGGINVTWGVIQKGGAKIATTADLGLYSLTSNHWMRFVTNNGPIKFYTDGGTNPIGNTSKFSIEADGKVAIGNVITPGNYKLYVESGILTERVRVSVRNTAEWSDYVFNADYKLRSIAELEAFVKLNKHLPNVPSAEDVVKEGIDMVKMDAKLLEKIEELALYIIQLKKENVELVKRMEKVENK